MMHSEFILVLYLYVSGESELLSSSFSVLFSLVLRLHLPLTCAHVYSTLSHKLVKVFIYAKEQK